MKLEGKKIAVLLADGFEDLEYWVTVMRLRGRGPRSSRSGRARSLSAARTHSKHRPTPPQTGSTRSSWTGW